MVILYGIKQCDTVKKAKKWLESHHIHFQFHDVRTDGLDKSTLRQWIDDIGHEALINRRSTTWRSLTKDEQKALAGDDALRLLLSYPTLIKRPVLDIESCLLVGFDASRYEKAFAPQLA